ncbi:MAG: hypothetical protein QOF53_4073 [Nocardioidaceae bacterium]|nr:hypothetical protein [Nocardioidaceae bacterium]
MEQGVEAAVRLARISRELLTLPNDEDAVHLIVGKAVEAVESADHAVISERTGKKLRTSASTSGIAEACDELQHRQGEGPCVDVAWNTEVALVSDAATETRWPAWGRRVAELGMASVLAIRLAAGTEMVGSLALYSRAPDAFDASSISMAFSFGTHAAVALSARRQQTRFVNAVEARHTIGVAQGVLMSRYGLSLDRSFALLRRYSNVTNIKLRDVARQVADTGELPDSRLAARYLGLPEGQPADRVPRTSAGPAARVPRGPQVPVGARPVEAPAPPRPRERREGGSPVTLARGSG